MIRIRKIDHATFETPSLDAQVDYYADVLGLTLVERTPDAAYLACGLDARSVVLRRGSEARCAGLAFQIAPEAELDAFGRQLTERGIAWDLRTDAQPGVPRALVFEDPKGTEIAVSPEPAAERQPYRGSGVVPLKLGHVAFSVGDVKAVVDWYVGVLGFRESDWMGDFFAFLRCSPDHHTINLVRGERTKMHHIAFELQDWAHVERACDILGRAGRPLVWGPGRHGMGHNIFTYHRDPDGHIVELFTELDRINDEDLGAFEPRPWHRDRPQKPKIWTPDVSAANLWGVAPPADFLS